MTAPPTLSPPPRHLDPARYPLDAAVARTLADPAARWGLGQAAIVVLGFYPILVADAILTVSLRLPSVAFSVIGYAAQATLLVAVARPAVRAAGSWAAALGWGPPRVSDSGRVLLWTIAAFLAMRVAMAITVALLPQLQRQNTSNVHVHDLNGAELAVLAVIAVVVAPMLEELTFRGLALRAAMRRFSFLPSAVGSSLFFGVSHAAEESTAAAALMLSVTMAAVGFVQCLLVRRTGRLGPAIAVHGLLNAIGLGLGLAFT